MSRFLDWIFLCDCLKSQKKGWFLLAFGKRRKDSIKKAILTITTFGFESYFYRKNSTEIVDGSTANIPILNQ